MEQQQAEMIHHQNQLKLHEKQKNQDTKKKKQ